jgi:hypothetical protein
LSSLNMERQFPITSPCLRYFEKSIGANEVDGVEVVVVVVVVTAVDEVVGVEEEVDDVVEVLDVV